MKNLRFTKVDFPLYLSTAKGVKVKVNGKNSEHRIYKLFHSHKVYFSASLFIKFKLEILSDISETTIEACE